MSQTGLDKLKKLRDEINARRVARGLAPKVPHNNPIDLQGILKEYRENKPNS